MANSSETKVETGNIVEIYVRHVKPLPPAERLRLLAMIAQDLADQRLVGEVEPKRNIMEFYGVGKENPVGMDAQEYVNQLRKEWDHRP